MSLFVRGVGVSTIGLPSMASGYASVARENLPVATTAMNIVQRLGGPTWTTLCATFLGWRLSLVPRDASGADAFASAFGLLCVLHLMLFLATLRLPWRSPRPGHAAPPPGTAPRAASISRVGSDAKGIG